VGILYAAGALIWLYWYITTFRAVVPANRHPSPRLYSNPITSTSPAASSTSSSTGSVIPSQSPDPLSTARCFHLSLFLTRRAFSFTFYCAGSSPVAFYIASHSL
jgi:hypothetical protein